MEVARKLWRHKIIAAATLAACIYIVQLTFFAFPRASAATVTSDEVFSTYLYTGNGSTQTITNGIDLSGQGGLVWLKARSAGQGHKLFDSVRGINYSLASETTAANDNETGTITSFTSSGFTLGSSYSQNTNGTTYASWTFREAPNFFDIVTYTGNGTNRTIAHNLEAIPGLIIYKDMDGVSNWIVVQGASFSEVAELNTTDGVNTDTYHLFGTGYVTPADANYLYVGTTSGGGAYTLNTSGHRYIAYVFASETGADSLIKYGWGSNANGGSDSAITLGWEPQFLLAKNRGTGGWFMVDNMRGVPTGSADAALSSNTGGAESASSNIVEFTSNGFIAKGGVGFNSGIDGFIYMAIRRPNKAPTVGTQVYNAGTYSGTNGNHDETVGFPSDMQWVKERQGEYSLLFDRLRGPSVGLMMDGTYADFTETLFGKSVGTFPNLLEASSPMTSVRIKGTDTAWNSNSSTYLHYNFRRYPGVFDVVAYTGTGVAHTEAHNLGVVPELIILKGRSTTYNWVVFSGYLPLTGAATSAWYDVSQGSSYVQLNTTGANGNGTGLTGIPTVTGVPLSTHAGINEASATQVMYLFATKPGISKVGSYTGNGTSQTINAGLSASAKFILIKRTDSTGDWYVWDSTRGIVAGNDPHLSLNTTVAEVTTDDSIDTNAAGFVVNQDAATNINVNAATYIYLALSDGAALSDSDSGTTFMLTFEAWMKKVTGLGSDEPPTLGGMMLLLLLAAYLSGKFANHARRLRFGKGSHPLGHSLKY